MSTALTTCPHCASELRPGMVRCRDCGERLVAPPSGAADSRPAARPAPPTFAQPATMPAARPEACAECGEPLRPAMIKCPACGVVRDLPRKAGSSGSLPTAQETKAIAPKPQAPARLADPPLERPSDVERRKPANGATKKSGAPAATAATPRRAARPSQPAPVTARSRAAARREESIRQQEQEDLAIAKSDAPGPSAPEKEAQPVKPLSWFAMRRLRRTLATSGASQPDLAEARRNAIQQSVVSNDPRLVPLLVAALADDWIMVREAAADALGKLHAEEAVEPLIGLVTTESGGDLRRVAGLALSNMADTRAVLPLLKLGLEQPQQRLWVSESIARIGKPALPTLFACLKHEDPGLRLDATVVLGKIKSRDAIPALLQAANDEHAIIRAHVAEALGQIADPRAVPTLVRLLEDSDSGVRANAANACCRVPDDCELEPLVELLRDQSAAVRGFAATALGRIADPRAAEPISRLTRDPSEDVRARAVDALAELEDPRTANWILPLLKDDHMPVRQRVVQTLGKVADDSVIRPLADALDDFHEHVRKQAVEALGRIGSPEALPMLTSSLRRDRSLEVQLAAVRALGNLGDPAAVPALKDVLTSGEFALRCRACVALGEIGSTEAVDILIPLLQDPATEIRYHASVSLGNLGDKRALKPLEPLIAETDPFVLRGVGRALKALGDPRGDALLEQAKQLASTGAKKAVSSAAPMATTATPETKRASRPRTNPLQTVRTVVISLGEIAAANWNGLDQGKQLIFGGSAGGAVVLALVVWWFLQPSSDTNKMLEAQLRGNVQSVAFVGTDELAMATTNGRFELWNVSSAALSSRSEVPGMRLIASSPDGQTLAVLYGDPKLEFRDGSGAVTGTVEGIGTPAAVQFHRDQPRIALAGLDGSVTLCNVPDGTARQSLSLALEGKVLSAAVSPDHVYSGFGLEDGRILLFVNETGKSHGTIPSKFHQKPVTAITFARNSPTFATAGADGATLIWSMETRSVVSQLPSKGNVPVFQMRLSTDGKLLARGFADGGGISVCDLDKLAAATNKQAVAESEIPLTVSDLNWTRLDSFAFSADGQSIVAGNADDPDVGIFNVKTGALVTTLSPF